MTDGHIDPDVNRWTSLAVLFYAGIGSASMLIVKPLIVGALIDDYQLTNQQAGLVAGAEIVGVGVAPLLMTLGGGSWNRRKVVVGGLLISMLACTGPAIFRDFENVLAFRSLAGLGAGLIASVVLSSLAVTRDPDRTFSLYYMASQVSGVVLFPALASVILLFGAAGAYASLGLFLMPVFFLLRSIPPSWQVDRKERGAPTHSGTLQPFPFLAASITLGASATFYIGYGAVWAFIERVGVSIDPDRSAVSSALALTLASAVLGALTASWLHTRRGRARPIAFSLSLSMIALLCIARASTLLSYTLGAMLFSFSWMLFFPYLTGLMAEQDKAGRVVVLGVTSQTAGMAIGPTLGGWLATSSDYSNILLLGIACDLVALTILFPTALISDNVSSGSRISSSRLVTGEVVK